MKANHTFEYTNTEAKDLQKCVKLVQEIFEAHTPAQEARLDPQRDFIVEYLQKVKQYILSNVGRTVHADNRYLPQVFPPTFGNGRAFEDAAGAMKLLDVLFFSLPDGLEPAYEERYEYVYGSLRALRRHFNFVERRLPLRN